MVSTRQLITVSSEKIDGGRYVVGDLPENQRPRIVMTLASMIQMVYAFGDRDAKANRCSYQAGLGKVSPHVPCNDGIWRELLDIIRIAPGSSVVDLYAIPQCTTSQKSLQKRQVFAFYPCNSEGRWCVCELLLNCLKFIIIIIISLFFKQC